MHLAPSHKNLIIKALMNLVAKCNFAISKIIVEDFNSIVLIEGYRKLKMEAKNILALDLPLKNILAIKISVIALNTLQEDEPNNAASITKTIKALTKIDNRSKCKLDNSFLIKIGL